MATPEQIRNDKLGEQLVKALKSRHFDAYYCSTKEEATKQILSLIPAEDVVAWGGSKTMETLGIINSVRNTNKVIDRDTAKTPEEKTEIMRKALLCDTYLCSVNGMSEDGILVNVDGTGNRVAATIYGPKSVIMAVGLNKVAKTEADALSRARNISAPINTQRFEIDTPCKKTGECANCKSAQSICNFIVTTRLCRPAGRIKIVLVGENLGF